MSNSISRRALNHLLPDGLVFGESHQKPNLNALLNAIAAVYDGRVAEIDAAFLDLFPDTTRELEQWEAEFNLPAFLLSEANRRARLASRWREVGGSDPKRLQDTLRGRGFDVYVHEPFDGTGTVRDPADVLGDPTAYSAMYGPFEYGGQTPTSGFQYGERDDPFGYLLDNVGGSPTIPTNSDYWPFIFYIGGQTFGSVAQVPRNQRLEFEELARGKSPTHLWIGMLIKYV